MMKIKPVLLLCALVVLIFAVGYMFLPAQTLSLLGYTTDATGLLAIQFVGILSMGYVASLWYIRDARRDVQKPIILSAFVAMGFAFLISLVDQISGMFGVLGWFGVANFGLAFAVFGYFWFFKMQVN
jgi:hypothetical protein